MLVLSDFADSQKKKSNPPPKKKPKTNQKTKKTKNIFQVSTHSNCLLMDLFNTSDQK